MNGRRAIFIYPPMSEVLDFAGPLQAVHELNLLDEPQYEIVHAGASATAQTAQGLAVASLAPLPEPREDDVVFIPGFPMRHAKPSVEIVRWLRACDAAGARILAVCTGAFLLGYAGLLDGKRCTTHWKRTTELQRAFPKTLVQTGRLFVQEGRVTTSAGISAGIDMTLDFIEQHHGAAAAAAVAREMVVYIRRDGSQKQESIYLEYRSHIDPGIHAVQDRLIAHPEEHSTLAELAGTANMSERNLTRAFRRATGISIASYRQRLRMEHARRLLANPSLTIEAVAERAGFADARHLRRLWREAHGASPREARFRLSSNSGGTVDATE